MTTRFAVCKAKIVRQRWHEAEVVKAHGQSSRIRPQTIPLLISYPWPFPPLLTVGYVEDSKQMCWFARDLYYILQLFITIIYPDLNVFSEHKTTLLIICYPLLPWCQTRTRDMDEDSRGRSVSPPALIAWVLLFLLVLSLNISRPEASVNKEITCCGAGWGHIWVGFDGFVHYNLLADSTFSSRCAQRFYLLSSSCPHKFNWKHKLSSQTNKG